MQQTNNENLQKINDPKYYIKEIFSDKEKLNLLKKNKLFIENDILNKEFINKWNQKKDLFDFLYKLDLFKYDNKICNFLNDLGVCLKNIKWSVINIKQEVKFNFNIYQNEILPYSEKLKIKKEKEYNNFLKSVENNRMHDISTGIFSVGDAEGRKLFNYLKGPIYSDEYNNEFNTISSKLRQCYALVYLNLELILYIFYTLDKDKPKIIYLTQKYENVKETWFNNEITEKDNQIFEFIHKFSIFYKHQEPLPSEDEKKLFNIKFLKEVFEFLNKLINKLEEVTDFNLFLWDSLNIKNEIDAALNPLGLTGFEID